VRKNHFYYFTSRCGHNKSSVGVLVERTSRLVLPAKMDGRDRRLGACGLLCQAELDC
jgi:hypothetical protein